jgi:hypothetical protein
MEQRTRLEIAANSHQWVFPLLTLDVVRTFYDLMGLGPELNAGLHEALRDATLAMRNETVKALANGMPAPTLTSFCRHVERAIGPATTEHLVWWLQHDRRFRLLPRRDAAGPGPNPFNALPSSTDPASGT